MNSQNTNQLDENNLSQLLRKQRYIKEKIEEYFSK